MATQGSRTGPASRQLCFDPSRLSEPDLDIAKFVADVRTRAPLSIIHDDLQAHVGSISQELIHQIQADFNKFVSIGPSISEVDGMVCGIAKPLTNVQKDLLDLRNTLAVDIAGLDDALQARRQLADRRSALQLLLRISELVTKCERLLKEIEQLEKDSAGRWRCVERLCSDWSQLAHALARCSKNTKFVSNLSYRVGHIQSALSHHLRLYLTQALADPAPRDTALQPVLSAYVVAGLIGEAELIYRQEVVTPFAASRILMKTPAVPGETRLTSSPADSFDNVVAEISLFLDERCGPTLKLCAECDQLRAFDFISQAVWPEVEKAIVAKMGPIFSPGIADIFHRCFTAGLRLFSAFEKHCLSPKRSRSLREHPATQDFWKKWNLPVYFQLRFQEISTPLGSTLEQEPSFVIQGPKSTDEGTNYQLLASDVYKVTATRTMIHAIRRCWDEDVYLEPLTHRFLRLTIQLMARYVTWVREGLDKDWTGSKALLNGAVAVYGDLELMKSRLPAEIASLLRIRPSAIPVSVLSAIDSAISEAVADSTNLFKPLQATITDKLTVSCVDGLQHVRGILATYRGMASRPPPTQHSRFVPTILRPLKTFSNESSRRMSELVTRKICIEVIERTAARYLEMATEILLNAKQQEDTLKRLNIGRGSSSTSASSDSDKISMQLYLDTSKFASEIDSLGIESKSISAFVSLYDMVAESSGVSTATTEETVDVTADESISQPPTATSVLETGETSAAAVKEQSDEP